MGILFNPLLIPIAGIVMTVLIVGIVFWYKARQKELEFHQDMRIREMEQQRKMQDMELEMEQLKARQAPDEAA
jgi:uncharacterized protein HemX